MPATKTATRRPVRTLSAPAFRMNAFGSPCIVAPRTERMEKGQLVRVPGDKNIYKLTCGMSITSDGTERFAAVVVR